MIDCSKIYYNTHKVCQYWLIISCCLLFFFIFWLFSLLIVSVANLSLERISSFIDDLKGVNIDGVNLAQYLIAIATIVAAIMAIGAHRVAIKTRRANAFCTLFTQLIGNHKDIFGKEELKTTAMEKYDTMIDPQILSQIDIKQNVFKVFCDYFQKAIELKSCQIDDNRISEIWNKYVNSIDNKVEFSHCFKYVFNELDTVLSQKRCVLDKKEKNHYLKIIQSYMNYDELFCYLINLMQHYHKNTGCDPNAVYDFRDCLKKFGFFDDLKHDENRYAKIINKLKDKTSINKLITIKVQ